MEHDSVRDHVQPESSRPIFKLPHYPRITLAEFRSLSFPDGGNVKIFCEGDTDDKAKAPSELSLTGEVGLACGFYKLGKRMNEDVNHIDADCGDLQKSVEPFFLCFARSCFQTRKGDQTFAACTAAGDPPARSSRCSRSISCTHASLRSRANSLHNGGPERLGRPNCQARAREASTTTVTD
jgi:hypothetical protein